MGKKIQLLIEDGKCDGKASTDAAQKLISVDKIDLLVVASCSSSSIAAAKVAQEAGITNIHSLSVTPLISSLGEYVFRYPN
jgi:branched-chain amino acid transport system substrate-binding protein